MEFTFLLVAVAGTALALQITRRLALPALLSIGIGTVAIVDAVQALPAGGQDVFGLSLQLTAGVRLLLLYAFTLNAALALFCLLRSETRQAAPMLFWAWVPWSIAALAESFPIAVLAWAFGLLLIALGLAPRRPGRVGGAANFLIIVVLSASMLLVANRFLERYPQTPEQFQIIETSVLLMAWAFGLLLAIFPLHLWLPALAEEAPPPVLVALTGLGQPLGLWLLFDMMRRYLWLTERSDLLSLMVDAGMATTIIGGLLAATERRTERLIAYASLFTLGVALIDLGRARPDLLWMSGLEVFARGVALTCLAGGLSVYYATPLRWVRAAAICAVALGGAALVGLPLTPAFVAHLPLWAEFAVTDLSLFIGLAVAALGMWVGVLRTLGPLVSAWAGETGSQEGEVILESYPAVIQEQASESFEQEEPVDEPAPALEPAIARQIGANRYMEVDVPGPLHEDLERGDQRSAAEASAPAHAEPVKGDIAEGPGDTGLEGAGESALKATPGTRPERPPERLKERVPAGGSATEAQPGGLAEGKVGEQAPETGSSGEKAAEAEEPYDPIEALRGVWSAVVKWVIATISRTYRLSPRLWHSIGVLIGHWPAWVGLAALLVLALAILVSGLYPNLLLDPITSALGRPDYLR